MRRWIISAAIPDRAPAGRKWRSHPIVIDWSTPITRVGCRKLNPTDVVDVARAVMPRDTVVTTDVGSHKLLVGQGWTTYAPKGVLMSNGLSSMGYRCQPP